MLEHTQLGAVQATSPLVGQLPAFLERLARSSRFYRDRLLGVDPASVTDLARFRELVPLMSKADTLADQRATPPYGSILGVEPEAIRQVHLTSGTSGFGQEVFALAEDDVDAIGDAWLPLFERAELTPGDVVVVLYPVTFLSVSRSLLEAGRRAGVVVVPLSGVDRDLVAGFIERFRPAAVIGRAAALALLADAFEADGGDLAGSSIRSVLSAGLGPGQSASLAARFGASVLEYYGCSQIGTIAGATCLEHGPTAPVIHLHHDRWLFEVLDPDTGAPVPDGAEGELVISTPLRAASPLLRFRMGDRVVLRGGCPCGRPWGIEAGSVGRYDDMLKIRGNNVWPTQIDEAVLVHPRVTDYRAAHTVDDRGIDGLAVVVASSAGRGEQAALAADLRTAIKRKTNVTPQLRIVASLPDPGLKPRRWVAEHELGALS